MNKVSDEDIHSLGSLKLAAKLCEKGLRYDLTVPFARYVVQHREELQMPFKRYQIQPVWRADRPQKDVTVSSISVMPMWLALILS